MPCPEPEINPCPLPHVVTIVNDTATFILVKDGSMLLHPITLGSSLSWGSEISIFGNVSIEPDYGGREYYALNIISIVQTGIITGKIVSESDPCFRCPPGMDCSVAATVQIRNDTGLFALWRDGRMVFSPPLYEELGGHFLGDMISIYGSFYKDDCTKESYTLNITAILRELSSDNFSAVCFKNEILSTTPVITVENDFILIEYNRFDHQCAEFVLKVSEVINDTLYVFFFDGTTEYFCAADCDFDVRLRIPKPTTPFSKVYYNGVVYDLKTSDIGQIISQQIQLSPNPTNGLIQIKGIENFSNLNYEVYNLAGQMIQSGNLQQTIDLSGKSGIYIFTITENQRIVAREKIIVK